MKRVRFLSFAVALASAAGAYAQSLQPQSAAQPSATAFHACLATLKTQAEKQGFSSANIDRAFASIHQLPRVLALDAHQPEFTQTFWQYLNARVTPSRIERGQTFLNAKQALLKRIFHRYGVQPAYLLALWGLESNFGANIGSVPALDSLATLACSPRRSHFFATELFAALKILKAGDISLASMQGSWAGAIGQTQFLPSVFNRYAVDFDNDGRRDLWNSPADALASAANYLRALGWKRGARWGNEVVVPPHFPWQLAGLDKTKAISAWRKLGLRPAHATPLPSASTKAALLLPAGRHGPAFLVYHNFHVIMKWNASTSYALAVGYLADRIAGGGKLKANPPDTKQSLKRSQLKALQSKLNTLGFNAGSVDGMLGRQTRAAIRAYQLHAGLPADGYPNPKLLQVLDITDQTRENTRQSRGNRG
jgi:membrane-bound lytic murein transglycosylase B